MVTVKITEQLAVDDTAAELLNAISSSRFCRSVYMSLPLELQQRHTPEAIARVLNEIHCRTASLIRQRNAALRAIDVALANDEDLAVISAGS